MATLDSLQFEMERRVVFLKPTTTMPDNTLLGYNDDPNLITTPSTPGETLLYAMPNGTRYVQTDASGDTLTEWYKKAQPNGWLPLGSSSDSSISIYGTTNDSWQINLDASGVILQDASSGLIIKNADGTSGTIIIGGMKLGSGTGYLKVVDGSVYVDSQSGNLLTGIGTLTGDGIIANFEVNHDINSLNHITTVYESSNNNMTYPDISIGLNTDKIYFYTAPEAGVNHRVVIMGF